MNDQVHHHSHDHGHHHHYRHPWPFLTQLEKFGEEYLIRKAPWQLPQKWKDTIVKILPVIVLVVALISLPGLLLSLLMVLGVGGFYTQPYIVLLLQTIITALITLFYFRGYDRLKKKQYAGWAYLFYAGLLGFISHLLQGDIIGNIIGFVAGMYLLFQVKEYYK